MNQNRFNRSMYQVKRTVIQSILCIWTSLQKLNIKESVVYSFLKSIAEAMVKKMNMQLISRDFAWNRFSNLSAEKQVQNLG